MPFHCNICEEESAKICIACTKDSCENHLCVKCGRCSDCCGCEVALNETGHDHLDQVHADHVVVEQVEVQMEQVTIVEERTTTMSAGGSGPLLAAEPLVEPTGIPAEDVAGEASDEEFPR